MGSLLLLTMTGTPHGYYSFGSWRSMQHPNKQVVPVVSPLLSSFSTHNHDSRQSSLSLNMDPHILFLMKRRPLLQTTLFAEFSYRKIYQKMRQQQQHVPRSGASGHGNGLTWAPFTCEEIPNKEESSQKESNMAADVTITSVEIDLPTGPAAAESVTDFNPTAGELVELAPERVVSSTPLLGAGEATVTVYRRPLTRLHSCKKKVHTIDGNTRCVDNEEDDLVVYVGMIIMGWLEVVDLLGAGTFGQVFLCKDLRISDGHFLHPSEIEGEDFQYWQCSHEYIPFSDPSLMPTHSSLVAVKVVKSRELFEQQSILEAEMLVYIGAQVADKQQTPGAEVSEGIGKGPSAMEPPESDARCQYVAHIFAHGVCYGHHCIVMERYGANLFEYVQSRDFKGLPMYQIQAIGRKILLALTLLHEECHVVHGDIKPENVLLTLDSCFSTPTVHSITAADTGGGCMGHDGGVSCGSRMTSEASSLLLCPSARVSLKHKLSDASASNTMGSSLLAPVPFRMRHYVSVGKNQSTPHDKELLGEGEGGVEDAAQGAQKVTLPSLKIKLIDFSSSFYVGAGIYTYVQSRYYRAPEVIVGAGYGPPIDIWSTGCLLAELLLGLPLLPGSSDFHQLYLMEEMLGPLPPELLQRGKQTADYYLVEHTESGGGVSVSGGSPNTGGNAAEGVSPFRLFREDEYRARHEDAPPVEWRCYFQYRTLAELLRNCMLSMEEKQIALGGLFPLAVGEPTEDMAPEAAGQQRPIKAIVDEMMQQRFWLYDLLKKMLHGDPSRRPTAHEALSHPFFMHTPNYMKPYVFVTE
ncbi:protein kinase [Trypanosoma rangeli SC58]|uniref:Protein kinase n=1 Tax=Trypanosoma rangeli SC58 TaxID=429131 RepID=A0A061J522_TRYRA|nr:protein kinase [Trypanosoma rangeli SC58]